MAATLAQQQQVRISVRNLSDEGLPVGTEVVRAQLSASEDWSEACNGVRTVVHCAARVHIMNDQAADPISEFRHINVEGTLNLAQQSAAAGVKRFIFLSSIKVNGDQTEADRPFTADQLPNPNDPYGISKMEAEEGLRALSQETGMEVVIIRPPLVYGPGVKGNFQAMMSWLWRGVPLPLGWVTENRRSLVFLDNLVDLIITCIDHPAAGNQTFLVSDDEDLSTAALLRRTAAGLGRPARLAPVPVGLILLAAKLIRRPNIAQRLCGSLQVDIGKAKQLLGWVPPVSVDEGVRITGERWIKAEGLR
ncbi:UDP-glucose 4-epimerase family protein [Azonexus sp. IMCC34842]|uniref:UDP-glucose 4-epimerase family protein n=1 Tax=Azonexus sp. IMCC34842 TaxID=3420950 RepID=UPI003D0CD342